MDGPCRAAIPRPLFAESRAPDALAVATRGDLAVIAFASDEDAVTVTAAEPGAPRHRVEIEAARSLFALAVVGDRALVLTHAACPGEGPARHCLFARAVAVADGAAGPPLSFETGEPIRTVRRTVSDRSLWLARSHRGARPAVDRLTAGDDGRVTRATFALGDRLDPGERATEILGLAADGDRWAALWRFGAIEDPASEAVLTTHAGEVDVHELHHALVVESFAWSGDAVELIVGWEFHRSARVRVRPDGEAEGPTRVDPGAVPAPFERRLVAELRPEGAALRLEIRDGAGDRYGPPLDLPPRGGRVADVARTPDGFLVVTATPTGVSSIAVRCDPR